MHLLVLGHEPVGHSLTRIQRPNELLFVLRGPEGIHGCRIERGNDLLSIPDILERRLILLDGHSGVLGDVDILQLVLMFFDPVKRASYRCIPNESDKSIAPSDDLGQEVVDGSIDIDCLGEVRIVLHTREGGSIQIVRLKQSYDVIHIDRQNILGDRIEIARRIGNDRVDVVVLLDVLFQPRNIDLELDPDLLLLGLVQEVDAIFNLPYLVQNRNGEVSVEFRQQTGTFGRGHVGSGIGRIVRISTHMTIPPSNEVFGVRLNTFQELSGTLTDTTAEVLPPFYSIFFGFHPFDVGDHILSRGHSSGQRLVGIQQHIPYLQSSPVGCITLDQIVITQRVILSEELIQRIPSQGIPHRILFLQ